MDSETENKLNYLIKQLETLDEERSLLCVDIKRIKAENSLEVNYDSDDFRWSTEVNRLRQDVFGFSEFQPLQRAAINAAIDGKDILLIMPKGKSLSYLLPCYQQPGITLLVTQLSSIRIEALQKLDIKYLDYDYSEKNIDELFDDVLNSNSPLKLISITPYLLRESKAFKAVLRQMYKAGRFSRLVIDDVQRCFEIDYKMLKLYQFISEMRKQYPKTPILGLSPFMTPATIADIHEKSVIQNCVVLKTVYQSNRVHKVLFDDEKVQLSLQESSNSAVSMMNYRIDQLAELIEDRFSGVSGVVYCETKDEALIIAEMLKDRGIDASNHFDKSKRSQVFVFDFISNLRINTRAKRFFQICYSMPHSIEKYYRMCSQIKSSETKIYCIILFRYQNFFVATNKCKNATEFESIYTMARYCMDQEKCRNLQLQQNFGEDVFYECNKMCDNCINSFDVRTINVHNCYMEITEILRQHDAKKKSQMTILGLADAWLGDHSGKSKKPISTIARSLRFNRATYAAILAQLLINDFLRLHLTFDRKAKVIVGRKVSTNEILIKIRPIYLIQSPATCGDNISSKDQNLSSENDHNKRAILRKARSLSTLFDSQSCAS